MASRSSAVRKSPAKSKLAAKAGPKAKAAAKKAAPKVGKLPEWNLADLYTAIDAPEVARDLDKLDADCAAFENAYKGQIAERIARSDGGEWLAEAITAGLAAGPPGGSRIDLAGATGVVEVIETLLSRRA